MLNADQTTSNASSTPADTDFRPERYWDAGTHPRGVEIASVDWAGNRTYYLDARSKKAGIAYDWRVDGDGEGASAGPPPTEQPLTVGELMSILEGYCLPGSMSILEEAWDQAWYAAQDNLDLSDSEAMGDGLDGVSETYTFTSDFYPTLSYLYDERFQAWRDQQKTALEE